ncbi:hypothetical protein CLOSTHATH_06397 [Hungatella hathewayi DSM 13479]|uniref:Uncharacterized protein n=1 Tax=Hungatella hathewayi DSM 13479 TaxID=566550 RepID=D3ARZ1_9FIRM|nr:hypothetical protein CLOSTHATH_06397 [Hungatella hathewayi DSM 13479]
MRDQQYKLSRQCLIMRHEAGPLRRQQMGIRRICGTVVCSTGALFSFY